MKLILDNNILFSLMNPNSVNSYIFSILKAEFFAPEFVKSEFNKYKTECLVKSGLSEHEFEIRQAELKEKVKFFELSEYDKFLKESLIVLSDPDDVDFLALALFLDSFIWSNDKELKKQSLIKVFPTSELIKLIGI